MIAVWPLLLLAAVFVVLTAPGDASTGRGCGWFWAWAGAGSLLTFSFLSALSIGVFVLPFAAALLLFVARRSPHPAERTGFVAGIGSVLLLVAALNVGDENGPDVTSWLVGGVLFTGAALTAYGVFGHARRA